LGKIIDFAGANCISHPDLDPELMQPTPSINPRLPLKRGEFDTLPEALDYAAQGDTGVNIYSSRGELTARCSYAEMRVLALEAAGRLAGLGVRRGEAVILLADTDVAFFVGFMGCSYLGALPTPAPIPVIFGERDDYVSGLRRRVMGSRAVAALGPEALLPLLREAVEGLDLKYCGSNEEFAQLPIAPLPGFSAKADDLVYLQFSSGSTRHPKGVEITQRALMANARLICQAGLDRRDGDRCTSWLPMYHDMGLVGFFLAPLLTQLSTDYLTTRDFARRPMTWLSLLSRNGGTLAYSPTFGYELCAKHAARAGPEGLDLSRWRAAGIGGDMVRPQVLEEFVMRFGDAGFRREAFVPSYGLAEATLAVSFAELDRGPRIVRLSRRALDGGDVVFDDSDDPELGREFVGCGKVLPEHILELRDEEGGLARADRIGRVFVRGPSLMRGYAYDPEESTRVLTADGWLDTGDLGFCQDGELYITGRAKDLILINGRNVWPQDIEWALEALPALRRGDAAAFSIDDGSGDQVVTLVQCRASDPEQRAQIRAQVLGVLRRLGFVDPVVELIKPGSLPQTSSGKLSRAKAKQNYLAQRAAGASAQRP
jgi:fatty-acyl-CoA synthase